MSDVQALGVSWPFVRKTLTRYVAQGFLSLMEHHAGDSSKLTPEQTRQVSQWIEQGPKAYH